MKRKPGYTPSMIKAPVSPELVLLAALILGVAISLGDIHFFSRGEGREALNALSVLRGEWLLPRGYGGVVASKPPLLHWMIAAFGWWNGSISEMASRLPSFLAAGGVTWFLLRRVPTSRRWFVALVLVTSFEWVRAAVSCRVDMVHAAFLGGALLLWPTLRTAKKGTTPLLVLGGLLTAASTLAKGPGLRSEGSECRSGTFCDDLVSGRGSLLRWRVCGTGPLLFLGEMSSGILY
jgi:4-amino-4-deoxy-L-arabinose transferase-like glycosyltransferase